MIDEQPWFVTKDVCDVLEIGNTSQALARLDDNEKNTLILNEGNRGNPNVTIINESGLYALIMGSRKPEARVFKRWITHEVLPSIRQTGMYVNGRKLPETYTDSLRLLLEEAERNEKLEAKC